MPAIGLEAKDNDPAVVTLAKAAITCKVDMGGLDRECEGFKAWRETVGKADPKPVKTLVNFLEDPDEKVRYLGASMIGQGYAEDPAAVKRVLAATSKEKSTLVAVPLAQSLGFLDLEKTGITADVTKLIQEHELMELRLALIMSGGSSNTAALFDALLPLATGSTDVKIRNVAQQAFQNIPADKHAQVCQMWLDNVDAADADIAGRASLLCGQESRCKDHWDKLLDKLDAKAKSGAMGIDMARGFESLHDRQEATAPQKARAKAVAQATLETASNGEYQRAAALDFLVKNGDKAVAKKFKNDPSQQVKDAAERALKK